MKTFKEIFLPITYDYGLVFGPEHIRAFDFAMPFLHKDGAFLTEAQQLKFIECLNGKCSIKTPIDRKDLEVKGVELYLKDKIFLTIRGWGRLTGVGGMNLDSEIASKLQDDFMNYIIEQLTKPK